MGEHAGHRRQIAGAYGKFAGGYDTSLRIFDLFAPFGFDLVAWRQGAVDALGLQPGDTVVDLGCGTGLNHPMLQEAVGSDGRIIGVDLTAAMLRQARLRARQAGWDNVDLLCMDAGEFEFPPDVDAVLATWSLILMPDAGRVVARACDALAPGGRLSVIDMLWPDALPYSVRHALFWLAPLGVTEETLRSRSWDAVHEEAASRLEDVSRRSFFFGFMYGLSGTKALPIA